jgi:hypothetical protein
MKVGDTVHTHFEPQPTSEYFGEEEKVDCLVNSTRAVLVRVCVFVWLVLGSQCACSGRRPDFDRTLQAAMSIERLGMRATGGGDAPVSNQCRPKRDRALRCQQTVREPDTKTWAGKRHCQRRWTRAEQQSV